jgi:Tol biopolymer transport system component
MTATVLDQAGEPMADVPVVWETPDTAVVRVSTTGMVTAVRNGRSRVWVRYLDLSASAPVFVRTPEVARNGLAYAGDLSGRAELWTVKHDGSNVSRLAFGDLQQLGDLGDYDWAPDGRRVVFVTGQEMALVDGDGAGQTALGSGEAGLQPRWSPDGSSILFTSPAGGAAPERQIWRTAPDGSNRTRLTDETGEAASWSPDGDRIVYLANQGSHHDLVVMNADGSGKVTIAEGVYTVRPSWSPDGTRIAFTSFDNGVVLNTVGADGEDPIRLADGAFWPDASDGPVWSPDGSHLLYVVGDPLQCDIFSIRADGTAVAANLTDSEGLNHSPAWSEDALSVAFVSTREGNEDIYLMAPDGGSLRNLTASPLVREWRPRWRPGG